MFPPENEQPIVRRHGVVFHERKTVACTERADVLEVAHTARRVALLQPRVELRVARRAGLAAIVERSVEREHAPRGKKRADAGKEALDLLPRHDVASIGRKQRGRLNGRERTVHVELDRLQKPRGLGFLAPQPNTRQVLRHVARLPGEVRQGGGGISRGLAGARADLEHMTPVGKDTPQDREDRLAVALAGFRIRFHLRSFHVAKGPNSAPKPRVDQAMPHAKASPLVRPPPARSSAQPKTTGLTTPAPKPTSERTA